MGWVLGLGFLLFRSRFRLPRRAAAHCLVHKSWAVSFVVLFEKKINSQGPGNPKTEEKKTKNSEGPENPQTEKKKKTARDRTSLRRKKQKKQPGTGQASDGKNKKNTLHIIESLGPFSLRTCFACLVIVWFCALHYRQFCHWDETLLLSLSVPSDCTSFANLFCGWCHRTTTRLRQLLQKKKNSQWPDNPKTGKKKKIKLVTLWRACGPFLSVLASRSDCAILRFALQAILPFWRVPYFVYCLQLVSQDNDSPSVAQKKKKTARDRTTLRPEKKTNLSQYREPVALVSPYFAWWLCDFALCTTGNFVTETRPYSFLYPYRLIALCLLICSAVGVTGQRLAFGGFSKKKKKQPGTGQP